MRASTYGYGSHRRRRRGKRRMRRNSKGRFIRSKGSHRRRHHRRRSSARRRRGHRRGRKAMGRKLGAAARKASKICHRRIKAGRLPRRWLKACFRAEMKKAL